MLKCAFFANSLEVAEEPGVGLSSSAVEGEVGAESEGAPPTVPPVQAPETTIPAPVEGDAAPTSEERPSAEEVALLTAVVGPMRPRREEEVVSAEVVEEIKRPMVPPQTVRIFCTRGDEVVVVEEEKTSLEVKRLRRTLNDCLLKIKVTTCA